MNNLIDLYLSFLSGFTIVKSNEKIRNLDYFISASAYVALISMY